MMLYHRINGMNIWTEGDLLNETLFSNRFDDKYVADCLPVIRYGKGKGK